MSKNNLANLFFLVAFVVTYVFAIFTPHQNLFLVIGFGIYLASRLSSVTKNENDREQNFSANGLRDSFAGALHIQAIAETEAGLNGLSFVDLEHDEQELYLARASKMLAAAMEAEMASDQTGCHCSAGAVPEGCVIVPVKPSPGLLVNYPVMNDGACVP